MITLHNFQVLGQQPATSSTRGQNTRTATNNRNTTTRTTTNHSTTASNSTTADTHNTVIATTATTSSPAGRRTAANTDSTSVERTAEGAESQADGICSTAAELTETAPPSYTDASHYTSVVTDDADSSAAENETPPPYSTRDSAADTDNEYYSA